MCVSQQQAGQIGEAGPFPFFQIDVGVKRLSLHLGDQIAQAVGMTVQVRMVDLEDIAGEDDLGALPGPGDNGLDFVRSQVLGLVDNEEDFDQGAPPDVGSAAVFLALIKMVIVWGLVLLL